MSLFDFAYANSIRCACVFHQSPANSICNDTALKFIEDISYCDISSEEIMC